MTVYNPKTSGLGAVGSYQVSGIPFFKGGLTATNTIQVLEFPSVTNWIYFVNTTENRFNDLRIAFSENGFSTNNYFKIGDSAFNYTPYETFYIKVERIYYMRDAGNVSFDIVAGLTSISNEFIPNNWSGSSGVG